MREFEKGKQKFIEVNGQEIPYDGVVKIYVDSASGNWVVSTPYRPETMFDLLTDAVDHFMEEATNVEPSGDPLPPEITGVDTVLMPSPTPDWN